MLEIRVQRGGGTDYDFEMLDELRQAIELGLVPTCDLLGEVLSRYSVGCFVGTKELNEYDNGVTYAYKGDPLRRMGLNSWVRMTTFKEFGT